MVSSKVQIQTLSHKDGSKAVQWESKGDPTFELKEIKKKNREQIVFFISIKILKNF